MIIEILYMILFVLVIIAYLCVLLHFAVFGLFVWLFVRGVARSFITDRAVAGSETEKVQESVSVKERSEAGRIVE